MTFKGLILLASVGLSACASQGFDQQKITDVYVQDFFTEDMQSCSTSDVNLSHHQAKEYFMRARPVEYRVIHDHYNYAPCYIEGVLKYRSKSYDWKIRSGSTGEIRIEGKTQYFVCDDCEDLFDN